MLTALRQRRQQKARRKKNNEKKFQSALESFFPGRGWRVARKGSVLKLIPANIIKLHERREAPEEEGKPLQSASHYYGFILSMLELNRRGKKRQKS
jgi:hypothetical protein